MHANYAVGVDVGGTRIAVGLVDRKGRILRDTKALTPRGGPFAIVDTIIDLIGEVSSTVHAGEISGIGVGLPAQIDFARQHVEFCTNLPLAGVDVRALVMSRVKHQVTLDNDGNLAAFGESRYGAARNVRHFLMITLGTGVGGGMFIGKEPYRGFRGLGAEVGHMVVQMDGPPCPCGGNGHIESYLGRPALAARGRELAKTYRGAAILEQAGGDPDLLTAEDIVKASLAGDEAATEILMEAGVILGRGLVGLVNLLNPQMIVVGGGIGEACPFLIDRAAEIIAAEALAGKRDVKVVPAELGNDAGVLGAAALAFEESDSKEGLNR